MRLSSLITCKVRDSHVAVRCAEARCQERSGNIIEALPQYAGGQHLQDSVKFRRQELARIIAALPERLYLVSRHAEQEHIFVSHALTNLNICTVKRAKRDRTVDHQLHVAGAGGFHTRNRDLLGQIAAGIMISASETL